jgi:hypothetical protein
MRTSSLVIAALTHASSFTAPGSPPGRRRMRAYTLRGRPAARPRPIGHGMSRAGTAADMNPPRPRLFQESAR